MNEIIFNYSDEDFIPSKNGIYIKRFSEYKDDSFVYAISQFLNDRGYKGVVYIGEKRGDIPFENISQEYWDKAVIKKADNVIIYMSGIEYDFNREDVKQLIIYSYDQTKRKNKNVMFNSKRYISGTDEDYNELKKMIDKVVDLIEKQ